MKTIDWRTTVAAVSPGFRTYAAHSSIATGRDLRRIIARDEKKAAKKERATGQGRPIQKQHSAVILPTAADKCKGVL